MPAEKHPCAARVYDNFHGYGCQKNGKHFEGEKWWCGIHAPSKAAERRAKKDAEYAAKNSHREQVSRRAAALGARAGVLVQVSWSHWGPSDTEVTINGDALDAILKEAGR